MMMFDLVRTLVCSVLICFSGASSPTGPFQANGIKIGEVSDRSAIIWCRLTAVPDGDPRDVDAAPGAAGDVRVRYRAAGDADAVTTAWYAVVEDRDFTRQITLDGLTPGTTYHVAVEARAGPGTSIASTVTGTLTTAPEPRAAAPITFAAVTCQAIRSIDAPMDGHRTYALMHALDPPLDFFVHTGDIVYYDREPLARDITRARQKWNRMFAFRHHRAFHRHVPSYFMKDDHDTLKNDCWPGQVYGDLTWDQGLAIFREQVPMGDTTYRTFRWGRDVQIWMTEHRDYRSPNRMPDGPDKTILGAEQKAWLKRTIRASDASFKFVIVPGPVVGPDKPGKNDNHSNPGFATEGRELRAFLAAQPNVYVITGDRHWQYASRDPETRLREFGCGPINGQHLFGGNPGYDETYHQYFAARGGFLTVSVTRENDVPHAIVRWHDVDAIGPDSGLPTVRHVERLVHVEPDPAPVRPIAPSAASIPRAASYRSLP